VVEEFDDATEAERALARMTRGSAAPSQSFADSSVKALLDTFATASAAPGGGSAAALAAATAAALVERCAASAAPSAEFHEAASRSRALRNLLTAAVDDDAEALEALALAYRSAGAADQQVISEALTNASKPPQRLRAAAAEVAALAGSLERRGPPRLREEARCAALLAEAAVLAAESIIAANGRGEAQRS
jgi:formiminotetrahydrofolate cyclodeaminase